MLLEKGADIEGKNKEGKTMKDLASEAKRGIMLDELEKVRALRGIHSMARDETDSEPEITTSS